VRFGPVPVVDAEGTLLAHAVKVGKARFAKARRLTAEDVALLRSEGVQTVIVAALGPDDIEENDAAARVAAALMVSGVEARPARTGRVNLHAGSAGLFSVDAALVDALNAIDPAITLATLADNARVEAGAMVATVKIIPFAVAAAKVEAAEAMLSGRSILRVDPFHPRRVALLQTTLDGVKRSVLDKTRTVTEARLARSDSAIAREWRMPHEAGRLAADLASAIGTADMAIVFGASALCDFDDVIPAAIRAAGGTVLRAGMPVDPGNLLVLGEIGGKKVLGAPGCARSPKENGFDWVLDRLLADREIAPDEIARMGVGGLLMEIAARPQPREAAARPSAGVHAVVLAAGRSSRMGGPNKLLATFDGEPLVRRVVRAALASRAKAVCVVAGHEAGRVRAALDGLPVEIVDNPDFASGLATSLAAGLGAVPAWAAGALIMLGDMPGVSAADLDRLVAAFESGGARGPVRATYDGKRGNPVILPRALFAPASRLDGDTGARPILEAEGAEVIDVEIGVGAALDVDTPEAMAAAGGVTAG
jgi:molybdenum cofactor cytidylyltransferase